MPNPADVGGANGTTANAIEAPDCPPPPQPTKPETKQTPASNSVGVTHALADPARMLRLQLIHSLQGMFS
ncbi:hypothetical protein SBA2_260071 [Acidobacteriia bacterium SbA2]|nr:hypothetical protein SBA2_260071 [Acidobacteriia bacterium SbA2]